MEKSVLTYRTRRNKAWVCERCGKTYASNTLLVEHMNTHLGVRPYVCGICSKDFASKYTHMAHEKAHQAQSRPFECEQCKKSFATKQGLTNHKQTHSKEKTFYCDRCDKKFGSVHSLRAHSISHSGERPFACTRCDKAFARRAEIKDHLRTHTGERPYQCELCGATFSQRSNLQSHKRATHFDDRRFKCTVCQEGFKRRRLLNYHISAKHTHIKDLECEECGMKFIYPDHLRKHRIIHTGLKPFVCEVCGKAFNNKDNKKVHLYIHSDRKPYECMVCSAGFMRKKQLVEHIEKENHPNETILIKPLRLKTNDAATAVAGTLENRNLLRLKTEDVATMNSAEKMDAAIAATLKNLYEHQYDKKQSIIDETAQQKVKDEEYGEVMEQTDVFIQDSKGTDLQILFNDAILIKPRLKNSDNHMATVHSAEEMDLADTILKEVYIYTEDQHGYKQTLVDEAISGTVEQNLNSDEYEDVEETDFIIQDEQGIDLQMLFNSKEFLERYVTQNIDGTTPPITVEFTNEIGEVQKAWVTLVSE